MKTWTFRLLAWTTLVVLPLVISPATLDPALPVRFLLLSAYLLILSVVFLPSWRRTERDALDRGTRNWLVLYSAYFLLSGVSLVLSWVNPADGIYQWMMILNLGAAVYFFNRLFKRYPEYLREVLHGAVILALISGIWGFIQFFALVVPAGMSHETTYLLKGSYANKNVYAEVLCLLIPFLAAAVIKGEKYWRNIAVAALLMVLFLVVVSLSRSAWVALFLAGFTALAGILLFYRKVFPKRGSLRKALTVLLMTGIILAAALVFIKTQGSEGLLGKQVHSLTHPTYGSAHDRMLLWKKSVEMSKEDPLWGKGLGTWKINILKYGNKGLKSADDVTFYQRPHNDYLWILTEQGLFALLCFLSCMAYILYLSIRNLIKSKEPNKIAALATGLMVLTIYLILSFFAFPRERIEHNILLAMALAILLNASSEGDPFFVAKSYRWITGILLTVGLLFAVWIGFIRYRSEVFTRKGFEERGRGEWEASFTDLKKAENSFYRFDPMSTPLAWYQGMAQYNMGNIDAALKEFSRARELAPWHQHVLNNLATCLVLKGDTMAAERYYKQAVSVSPGFNDAWINLASVCYNTRDLEGAYQAIHSVDTSCTLENYHPYLRVILRGYALPKIPGFRMPELTPCLETILKDDKWLVDIHTKSIKEKRTFMHQLLLDAVWDLEQHGEKKLAMQYRNDVSLFYEKN